jgi:membrane protein
VTSLASILLIVIAIAGLVFGHDAAQKAIVGQLAGLMGKSSADMLQSAMQSASNTTSGTIGTIIGIVTLMVTAQVGGPGSGDLEFRDQTIGPTGQCL